MAIILRVMVLSLLMQVYLCSIGEDKRGCERWNQDETNKENVCCQACYRGNRLVKKCGSNPKDLCTPCESGTYAEIANSDYTCSPCRHCGGALVTEKACTARSNTKCGCQQGLLCGDAQCSFCVKKCNKGEEPTSNRSCRPCPHGTFNDQSHQKCKPWSKCTNPSEYIVPGNASTDIKCTNVSTNPTYRPKQHGTTDQRWPLVLSVITTVTLMSICLIIIIIVSVKILWKRKKTKKTVTKTPIIRTPTDDPRTLIAIECSFHEAQQEQGSSTESLDSKESSHQLIA